MLLKVFLTYKTVTIKALETFSFSLQISLNGLKYQFQTIKFNTFLAKALLPFLLKCSFMMPRCSSYLKY